MRLSAIDAVGHGLLNLRANWQLILVQAFQSLVVTLVGLLGLLPIVFVLGWKVVSGAASRIGRGGEEQILESITAAGVPLIFAILVAGLIWTIAFIVYCYFQAGILGVLAAGERRAEEEGARWANFREFSLAGFRRNAESLTWPVFWVVNLFAVVAFVLFMIFAVLAGLVVAVRLGDGVGVGTVLLGCFGLGVFLLVMMVMSVWLQLALAKVATGTRGVWASTRSSFATMLRRFPGLALLFLLLIAASIGVAVVLMPLSLLLESVFRGRMSFYLAGQGIITLFQWFLGGLVTIGWSATLVALVSGEREVVG